MDSHLMASGSDDSRVKIWSLNAEHSVATLEAKANVCCVKFNPYSRYCLAYGAADHCVHYVDLRQPKEPLRVFKGHRKAVSYVKFLSDRELVSASTDSQLKLWTVEDNVSCRSFRGHTNEKNFVGLSTTDGSQDDRRDLIACGSENNALYLYSKGLSQPLLHYRFDVVKSALLLDKERAEQEESAEFVSAVCWKPDSNVIVAANSQGTIKILELV
jgi:E3 ubiquitin-protein ligase RFWD2